MDAEIRDRDNTAFRQLINNTRAGIKTTVDLALVRQCRDAIFRPLANYGKLKMVGYYITGATGNYRTSHCTHRHLKKKQARNCLRRAIHRRWNESF